MTARGDSLGCSRNPGSNYYAGLTHQSMIDLGADDAVKVSAFHSLWVGKAGGELLRGSPPLSGASVLSASRLEPLVPCMGLFLSRSFGTPAHLLHLFFVRSESRSLYGAFLVKEFRHAGAPPSSFLCSIRKPFLV